MSPAASLSDLRASPLGQAKRQVPVKSVATLGLIAAMVGLGVCGCRSTSSASGSNPTSSTAGSNPALNPAPIITTILPNGAPGGGATFTLTVNGTNFLASSVVSFGGTALATTFVSATRLTAVIPAAAIASPGNAAVMVTNPTVGGSSYGSNAVNFAITNGTNPVATIGALVPNGVAVGGPGFTLTIFGQGFLLSSVVEWNGSNLPTTFVSGQSLTAQVPEVDVAAIETSTVTVFNPGGSSNEWPFTVGGCPQSVALDPTGKFAYVANSGCSPTVGDSVGNISMYTIDSSTGTLTRIGTSVAADFGTGSLAVDPSGRFVYATNWGDGDYGGSVSMYTIDATSGALTSTGTVVAPCAPPPSPGSCAPWSVAIDPSGMFAYVADEGGFAPTSVSLYSVNSATGSLTFVGLTTATGRASTVTVDPSGKFAYVGDVSNGFPGEDNNVAIYSINAGALTFVETVAAGLSPISIAIDPFGRFAYVANSDSNDVSMYTINATTGALTSIGPVAVGTNPSCVAVDPTGKFVYVTNSGSNDVSMFTINAATGVLTSAGSLAAQLSPSSIAIHPSAKYAYVTNSSSNTVSIYSIDAATGALTLIGTIGS